MKISRRAALVTIGAAASAQAPLSAQKRPPAQTVLLDRLCETIVPGATEAGAGKFIRLLMSENEDYRRRIAGGLTWLNSRCRSRFDREYLELEEGRQREMLDQIAYRANGEEDPSLTPGIEFFAFLRQLAMDGFFTSEQGVEYLEYKGNGFLTEFPGCPEPE